MSDGLQTGINSIGAMKSQSQLSLEPSPLWMAAWIFWRSGLKG
jgi:hypothetical protein